MAGVWVGDSKIRMRVDLPTESLLRKVIDRVAPGIRDELEAEAARVYEQARAEWPVRTGRSRDGLQYGIVVGERMTTISARIWNDVEYAKYIKIAGRGAFIRAIRAGGMARRSKYAGKSAFVELLRKPMQGRSKEIAQRISAILAAGVNRG